MPNCAGPRVCSLHQAGVDNERQAFARLGMLDFIKQDRRHQHWVHPLPSRLTQDHRFEFAQLRQGVAAQRLQLIHAAGHQLHQAMLWTMDAEATLQQHQLIGRERQWTVRLVSDP